MDGDGNPAYTGRAIFSHLFTVLDCEYVSATFVGNSPAVDEEGIIVRKEAKDLRDSRREEREARMAEIKRDPFA